ncbi:MAG: carboxymuconolactone decarboxylase family protein [Caldilineae bacterium]|nr:MAG: carboxymuconolactone decarboxylase family protein [Caldilineae bacterium]
MKRFRRRTYTRQTFWDEFRYLMTHRGDIRRAMRGGLVPAAFRERLMLVVTEVNGCPYCRAFHSQEALKAGLTPEELQVYLGGAIPEDAPAHEAPALLYARHWAEQNAQPDPEATRRLFDVYGAETAQAILTALRLIRMGNLLGNTWDYLLYRLSFGRLGLRQDEARYAPPMLQ